MVGWWWMACVGSVAAPPGTEARFEANTARLELPAAEGRGALPIRVSWPEGATGVPVIVFSHGMGGSRDGYEALVRVWVEAGFAVVQPTHGDSIVHLSKQELARHGSFEDFAKDSANANTWRGRPAEVSVVVDQLGWIVSQVEGLEPGDIDAERLGVGGHSFGAHTAMLVGGATMHVRGPQQLADPRADAVVLISPQGTGMAMRADSYGSITPPALMITGSKDVSPRTGKGHEWRLEAWEGLPSEHAWLLFIDEADHSFGGIGGRPGTSADKTARQAVQRTTLQFWKAQLADDAAAATWLDSDGIAAESGTRVRLERKAPPSDPAPGPR